MSVENTINIEFFQFSDNVPDPESLRSFPPLGYGTPYLVFRWSRSNYLPSKGDLIHHVNDTFTVINCPYLWFDQNKVRIFIQNLDWK